MPKNKEVLYCRNCFQAITVENGGKYNAASIIKCPNCDSSMTLGIGRSNYKAYLQAQSQTIQNDSKSSEIKSAIEEEDKKSRERRKQLEDLQKQIMEEEREAEQKKQKLLDEYYESQGLTIYEADPNTDFTTITVKLPREMYNIISETARYYYKGNMTTYLQSVIASDITKNLEFYQEYNKTHKISGRAKRDDVFTREALLEEARAYVGVKSLDTRSMEHALVIDNIFKNNIKEQIYTIEINGKKTSSTDADEIYREIKIAFDKYKKDHEDIGDGMPVTLTYHDKERDRKVVKYILEDATNVLNYVHEKKRGFILAYDLYDVFMRSNYSRVVLVAVKHANTVISAEKNGVETTRPKRKASIIAPPKDADSSKTQEIVVAGIPMEVEIIDSNANATNLEDLKSEKVFHAKIVRKADSSKHPIPSSGVYKRTVAKKGRP